MQKTILKLTTLLMILGALCVGCTDETADDLSEYDGTYSGTVYNSEYEEVGYWAFTVSDGAISADSSSDYAITGTVDADGNVTASTSNEDGEEINISGTISNDEFSGIWSFVDGSNAGTLTGDNESEETSSSGLVGSYGVYSEDQTIVITFYDDSHFSFVQTDGNEPDGETGLEIGAYTWDSETTEFSPTVHINLYEHWGFAGDDIESLYVSDDILYIYYEEEGLVSVPRLVSDTNKLVGTWRANGDQDFSWDNLTYYTFLDSEHFVYVESIFDEDHEYSGIQLGTYSWDSETNEYSQTLTYSPEGAEWGCINFDIDEMTVNSDSISGYYLGENLATFYSVQ